MSTLAMCTGCIWTYSTIPRQRTQPHQGGGGVAGRWEFGCLVFWDAPVSSRPVGNVQVAVATDLSKCRLAHTLLRLSQEHKAALELKSKV